MSRAAKPGAAKSPGKGPVRAKGMVQADRSQARGMKPTPQGEGGPLPPRGQKSAPTATMGPRAVRDYSGKGSGSSIATRANSSGRRRGVSG